MSRKDLSSLFLLGFLGTGHCIGMCGPLVLAIPAQAGRISAHLRKRPAPPLSGSEMLGLTTAAMLMPIEEFMTRIESLLPYLESRECGLETRHPRILVSSDRLDDAGYLELVEGSGCLVAMDDLDTGARWFWELTDAAHASSLGERLEALAYRYHAQTASPCMMNWAEQVEQVASWVKAFGIDGVLELPLMYSRSRQIRSARKRVEEDRVSDRHSESRRRGLLPVLVSGDKASRPGSLDAGRRPALL